MQASDDFLTYIVSRRHAQSKWALRLDLLLYMTRTASNVPQVLGSTFYCKVLSFFHRKEKKRKQREKKKVSNSTGTLLKVIILIDVLLKVQGCRLLCVVYFVFSASASDISICLF